MWFYMKIFFNFLWNATKLNGKMFGRNAIYDFFKRCSGVLKSAIEIYCPSTMAQIFLVFSQFFTIYRADLSFTLQLFCSIGFQVEWKWVFFNDKKRALSVFFVEFNFEWWKRPSFAHEETFQWKELLLLTLFFPFSRYVFISQQDPKKGKYRE